MVATFHLLCLEHRIKYGNSEFENCTQQLLSTTRPCCSIEFIESFLFWVILVAYDIGIYICISALHAKYFEIWKNILWNWQVHCFIAPSIKRRVFLGVRSESILPFMQSFFSQENCVSFSLLVSCLSLSQSA